MPIEISSANFQSEVKDSSVPVLVDFWAEWCAPCKMIAPVVDEISKELEGRLKVGKVDVDSEADIASEFGILSIPTLLLFKDGKVVDKKVGAAQKSAIMAMLQPQLD